MTDPGAIPQRAATASTRPTESATDPRDWMQRWRDGLRALFSATVPVNVVLARLFYLGIILSVSILINLYWSRHAEFNHILSYGSFVIFGFFAVQALTIAICYGLMLGSIRLAFALRKTKGRPAQFLRIFLLYIVRLGVHVEALSALTLGVVVVVPWLWCRLAAAVSIQFFGPIVVEGMDTWLKRNRAGTLTAMFATRWGTARALGMSVFGLVLFLAAAPLQCRTILPLFAVVLVGGGVRIFVISRLATRVKKETHHERTQDRERETPDTSEDVFAAARLNDDKLDAKTHELVREVQQRPFLRRLGALPRTHVPELAQTVASIIVVGILLLPVIFTLNWGDLGDKRGARDLRFRLHRSEGHASLSGAPDASLFLISDSQFHELRGARDGGHLDMIDAVVPVAVRPAELDLLEGATLAHFAAVYKKLSTLPAYRETMWAHLGDIGDLGCESELDRFAGYANRFGLANLAGIAPGNHDSTFVGNFFWHPDWSSACYPSAPSQKTFANKQIQDLESNVHGATKSVSHILGKTGLARVTPIGTVKGHPIVAVFLDTSDYTGFYLGSAGVQGSISLRQKWWVDGELSKALSQDPKTRFVFFMHHPFDELSRQGRSFVRSIVDGVSENTLALVSSHTHRAGCRNQYFNKGISELVVGSTIDPPQQASVLEIRSDGSKYELTLRMVQSILRSGSSEPFAPETVDIEIADCATLVANLEENRKAECIDFLKSTRVPPGYCPSEPRPVEHPDQPWLVKCEQQWRAHNLLRCIGYPDTPKFPLDPTNTELWSTLDNQLFKGRGPVDEKTLTCLSWIASVEQGHKSENWRFREARGYAWEGSSVPPAKTIVVQGGNASCEEQDW